MKLPELAVPTFYTELPSNKQKVKFRPYLVKEEKVLLMALQGDGNKQEDITEAIRNLISACILSDDVAIEKLPSFDLEWLFLKIRAKSVGELIEPKLIIPPEDCGDKNKGCKLPIQVNLDKIEVKRDENHKDIVMLTDSVGIKLTYPTIEMAGKLSVTPDSTNAIGIILDVISACVVQVFDGENVYQEKGYDGDWNADIRTMIDNMTHEQMDAVRQFFLTMPKIQYKVDMVCAKCKAPIKRDIEGIMDFFI